MILLTIVRIVGALQNRKAASHAHRGIPERILLLRPDHFGDAILMTPVLQAMRTYAPDAHITMMIGPWSSEVVARHPALDRLITCPFPGFQRTPQRALDPYILLLRTAQQVRREGYDLAINLRSDFWWGAALVYLAGVPRRVGYTVQPGTPFLTSSLPFPSVEHATISNLRLGSAGLQALGHSALEEPYTPAKYPLSFQPTEAERVWVDERLQGEGIDSEEPVVVLHAGTGGAVKLWRNEAWSHIADKLATTEVFPRAARIVLTGSKSEQAMVEEIAREMKSSPVLLTNTTVGQLAALLARAQLVLGVDNGPLHMAAAQNTPSLRLFGPTDPHIFGPWGDPERHRVIAAIQPCATCLKIPCGRLDFRSEELSGHPCVRNITEQRVMQTITELVQTEISLRER